MSWYKSGVAIACNSCTSKDKASCYSTASAGSSDFTLSRFLRNFIQLEMPAQTCKMESKPSP